MTTEFINNPAPNMALNRSAAGPIASLDWNVKDLVNMKLKIAEMINAPLETTTIGANLR